MGGVFCEISVLKSKWVPCQNVTELKFTEMNLKYPHLIVLKVPFSFRN